MATLYRNTDAYGNVTLQGTMDQWRAFLRSYPEWYQEYLDRFYEGDEGEPLPYDEWVESDLREHLVKLEPGETWPTLGTIEP